jgi:hypothetical protein
VFVTCPPPGLSDKVAIFIGDNRRRGGVHGLAFGTVFFVLLLAGVILVVVIPVFVLEQATATPVFV